MAQLSYKVPFITKEVYAKELCMKDYKTLLKAIIGNDLNHDVANNINQIIVTATNLKNIKNVQHLNVVEYFIILTFIRMISIGNVLNLVSTKDDVRTNLTLNLSSTIKNISEALIKDSEVIHNSDTVVCGIPLVKDITESNFSVVNYIKKIIIDNHIEFEGDVIKKAVEYITPLHLSKVKVNHKNAAEKIYQCLFFEAPDKQFNIPFFIDADTIYYLIKLMFSDNLMNIFSDIFSLSKRSNISAEYINSITPGEFKIFTKLLEKEQHEAQETL
jgi:hypothetical protein